MREDPLQRLEADAITPPINSPFFFSLPFRVSFHCDQNILLILPLVTILIMQKGWQSFYSKGVESLITFNNSLVQDIAEIWRWEQINTRKA